MPFYEARQARKRTKLIEYASTPSTETRQAREIVNHVSTSSSQITWAREHIT